jgi:hypothetical protein
MPSPNPIRVRTRPAPPAKKIGAENVQRVTTELYGKTEERVERDVEVFVTEPAFLRLNVGVTKNLGNYESLRVDVAVTVPCYKEVLEQTFDGGAEKVNALLSAEVDRYLNAEEG